MNDVHDHPNPEDMELPDLIEMLIEARSLYEEANRVSAEMKAAYDDLAINVLPEKMKEAGFDSVTKDDTVVYLRTDLRANVRSDERGALAAALREMGEGDLITEYVFPQTLTAWVKDRLNDGEAIPPQVDLSSVTRAVPRKK